MRRNHKAGIAPFTAGMIAIILIVAGTYFGFTKSNPFASPFELKAAFKTVNDLKPNSPVRVAGVTIGKVTSVEPIGDSSSGAVVTMRLDEKGLPIHRDAQIKVRPRIFLEGNFFVDVQPGTPSAPLIEDGDLIPAQQTSAPVQFGQVLAALQSDTRADLKTVLQEYGDGLAGEGGKGYNRSLQYWKGAYRDSAIVNEATIGEKPGDLAGYVEHSGTVSAALDRNREQLKSLVSDFATTAQAIGVEDQRLSAAIRELPRTLRVGRTALGNLDEALPPLRRLVNDFRPAVRSSNPALKASIPFARELRGLVSEQELRGLVRDLKPVVPLLVELNEGGVALQEETRALSSCQNNVVGPWLDSTLEDPNLPASGPVFQEGVKWLPGIAGESRSFDANGQYVKTLAKGANSAMLLPGGRFFLTDGLVQGANPPKAPEPAYKPDVACETQQPPDLRSFPVAVPAQIPLDTTSPVVRARSAKAQERAVKWLRGQLRYEGLDKRLRVLSDAVTPAQAQRLVKNFKGSR